MYPVSVHSVPYTNYFPYAFYHPLGLVQKITPLAYNNALKLTIARYYTPSGRCIQVNPLLLLQLYMPLISSLYCNHINRTPFLFFTLPPFALLR